MDRLGVLAESILHVTLVLALVAVIDLVDGERGFALAAHDLNSTVGARVETRAVTMPLPLDGFLVLVAEQQRALEVNSVAFAHRLRRFLWLE